jgi:hypothetical protein
MELVLKLFVQAGEFTQTDGRRIIHLNALEALWVSFQGAGQYQCVSRVAFRAMRLCDGRGSGLIALGLLKILKTRLPRVSQQALPRKLQAQSLFGRRARARLAEPINEILQTLAAVRRVVSIDHPSLMI